MTIEFEKRDTGLFLYARGEADDKAIDAILANGQQITKASCREPGEALLGVLCRLKSLRELALFADETPIDTAYVARLSWLTSLVLDTDFKYAIDLARFPNLQHFGATWSKGIKGLGSSLNLRSVNVSHLPQSDIKRLCEVPCLTQLAIYSSPLKSLDGLECLRSLRALDLVSLRSLESIRAICALPMLERLRIDTCRKLRSLDDVAEVTNLRDVQLDNLNEVDTLLPLRKLKQLQSVSFTESTNVLDGQIRFLKEMGLTDVRYQIVSTMIISMIT